MADLRNKLNVLKRIAFEFNKENIQWAVGASLLLYLKDKINTFNDIDIMIHLGDAEKCERILSEIGEPMVSQPNPQFDSISFIQYNIGGIEVDVMAGMAIIEHGVKHDCSFTRDQVAEFVKLEGELIPLHQLSLWHQYYKWMNRPEKAKLLD